MRFVFIALIMDVCKVNTITVIMNGSRVTIQLSEKDRNEIKVKYVDD